MTNNYFKILLILCALFVIVHPIALADGNNGIESVTNGISAINDTMEGLYKSVKKFIYWVAAIAAVPLIASAFITMLNGNQEMSKKLFMIIGGIIAFFGLLYLVELVFEISK